MQLIPKSWSCTFYKQFALFSVHSSKSEAIDMQVSFHYYGRNHETNLAEMHLILKSAAIS
jgi:hypothetical protein